MEQPVEHDEYFPFGLQLESSRPIYFDDPLLKGAESAKEKLDGREDASREPNVKNFGTIFSVDANDLSQAGWGVLLSESVTPEIKNALKPLLDLRGRQAGNLYREFQVGVALRSAITSHAWLSSLGPREDVVDPEEGIPYYLLIVAPPTEVSFEFQYSLDIHWAVGRIWFDDSAAFGRYAQSVVDYEKVGISIPTSRSVAIFSPTHPSDSATELFNKQVATPIHTPNKGRVSLWEATKFRCDDLFRENATKEKLLSLYLAKAALPPALLFAGCHGLACAPDNSNQLAIQGALICQDWDGYSKVGPDHWVAATDFSSGARLLGTMHFLFACYGGGCVEFDNFSRKDSEPKRVASTPFLSKLSQKLLSHENGGALAVFAHIERAWAYSFRSDRGRGQIQGFKDCIGRLLRGERIGHANESFNSRWPSLSALILEEDFTNPRKQDTLRQLHVAKDDARNYVVIGDPAVRFRVEDMPL